MSTYVKLNEDKNLIIDIIIADSELISQGALGSPDIFVKIDNTETIFIGQEFDYNNRTPIAPVFPNSIENKELLADVEQVRKFRKSEYPPIEDFVDAWVKNDDIGLEEYRNKCLSVKAKYPKPNNNS